MNLSYINSVYLTLKRWVLQCNKLSKCGKYVQRFWVKQMMYGHYIHGSLSFLSLSLSPVLSCLFLFLLSYISWYYPIYLTYFEAMKFALHYLYEIIFLWGIPFWLCFDINIAITIFFHFCLSNIILTFILYLCLMDQFLKMSHKHEVT